MSAQRAFLGMSHSPLIGLNPVASAIEDELQSAIAAARISRILIRNWWY
ncbi:hypothetical protein LP417_35970 (plasmid) [Polaromonas sp. P1-6]|nr:hypothetical protein LP417_35970 [Polaromonas sp. P1-6]